MADILSRIETLQDIMLCAHELCSWQLSNDGTLYYSNSPDKDFFYGLFSVSVCATAMKTHFSDSEYPIILIDKLGFAWIASVQKYNGSIVFYHILGPIFTVEASEAYIKKCCKEMRLSNELAQQLLTKIQNVPIISLSHCTDYAIMLFHCITNSRINANLVAIQDKAADKLDGAEWFDSEWHGTWEIEQMIFNSIKNGIAPSRIQLQHTGKVGKMSPGNPLRQAQNEFLVYTILCSRAAILGGVSSEGAYNLTDYYIQLSEACTEPNSVYSLSEEMQNAFVRRVQAIKKKQGYSPAVLASMEYIETHKLEKIHMEKMAKELGYTPYYLSHLFQKETKISIKDYINEKKIELAKELLLISSNTSADVSERLNFSSPSYFSAIFRKYTGQTPSDYKNSHPPVN
ncbi:MAG: helix-turn-helix transcriptional regulator [Lachnospiraceae bacterium]